MARIRSVKPEFRTSLTVTSWPRDVRLFFVLIWGYMDDHGRGIDEPRLIKADCFPLDDDVTPAVIDGWLDLMARTGTVLRYRVNGRRYLAIPEWSLHQKPQHPRDSEVPQPPIEHVETPPDPPHDDLMKPSGEGPEGDMSSSLLRGSSSGGVVTSSSTSADAEPETQNVLPIDAKAEPPPPRQDVEHLCRLLIELLRANGYRKQINLTEAWRDDARLLLDRDKVPIAEAEAVMRWALADKFWKTNIASMPTFRTKYDQLRLKRESELGPTTASLPATGTSPWDRNR